MRFHVVVVFGLGKKIIFKSVLGHCGPVRICNAWKLLPCNAVQLIFFCRFRSNSSYCAALVKNFSKNFQKTFRNCIRLLVNLGTFKLICDYVGCTHGQSRVVSQPLIHALLFIRVAILLSYSINSIQVALTILTFQANPLSCHKFRLSELPYISA